MAIGQMANRWFVVVDDGESKMIMIMIMIMSMVENDVGKPKTVGDNERKRKRN